MIKKFKGDGRTLRREYNREYMSIRKERKKRLHKGRKREKKNKKKEVEVKKERRGEEY